MMAGRWVGAAAEKTDPGLQRTSPTPPPLASNLLPLPPGQRDPGSKGPGEAQEDQPLDTEPVPCDRSRAGMWKGRQRTWHRGRRDPGKAGLEGRGGEEGGTQARDG